MDEFGPNGEQVRRFLKAAAGLRAEHVQPISAIGDQPEVSAAHEVVLRVPSPAGEHRAVDLAAQQLIRGLLRSFPRATSTAERLVMTGFTFLLKAAVYAIAFRANLDDDTVALVVDPFADVLGFEWRSSGAGAG